MIGRALKLLIGTRTQVIEAYTNKTLTCGELEYRDGELKILGGTIRNVVEIRLRDAEMPTIYMETKASRRFLYHGKEESC